MARREVSLLSHDDREAAAIKAGVRAELFFLSFLLPLGIRYLSENPAMEREREGKQSETARKGRESRADLLRPSLSSR
jgi:hypothetical protein